MKKILFTLFAACAAFAASAQIEQGTIVLSGASNLNFISNDEKAGDDSNFHLAVKGGYFFMENLAAGLSINYEKYSEADDADTAFGPFVRYYFNGKIFGGIGYNFGSTGGESYSELPIEVGYAAFLNDVVAIEPSLGYTMYGGDAADGSSFGLNIGISVYLGRGE